MSAVSYLRDQLRALVSPEALDTVVEYLGSLPAEETSLQEMEGFLREVLGREPGLGDTLRVFLDKRREERISPNEAISASWTQPDSALSSLTLQLSALLSVDPMAKGPLCGCMATRHPFIGSCLGCGRLYCEMERLGICVFCDGSVCPPCSADDLASKGITDERVLRAYRQKDKLLLFDKENSKRTQVLDAQVSSTLNGVGPH